MNLKCNQTHSKFYWFIHRNHSDSRFLPRNTFRHKLESKHLEPSRARTPAVELHDLLSPLLRPLLSHHRARIRRHLLGPVIRPEIGLGALLHAPEGVVPPRKTLVLHRLHRAYARRDYPTSFGSTHSLNFTLDANFYISYNANNVKFGFYL